MKTPRDRKKEQQNQPTQLLSTESELSKTVAPPPFQLAASNDAPIQRECGENMSCEPSDYYVNESTSWSGSGSSVGADGNISLGGTYTDSTTLYQDYDEHSSYSEAYGGGVSFNPNNGQVGVNASYSETTVENGESTTNSISGGGYLDFNSNGELEGGGANMSVQQGPITVSVGGGITSSAQPPVLQPDGTYKVTWTRSVTGNVGGGYSQSGRGASGSISGGSTVTGSRSFATQTAAQSFFENRDWAEIDPSDARQLGQGDQISTSDSTSLSGGGSVSIAGVKVGATITVGTSRSVEVTGLGNERISVKVTDNDTLGGALSMGAPGISLTGGVSSTDVEGYIVHFDLSTTAGQNAWLYLRTIGALPTSGYNLHGIINGEVWTETSGFSLMGVTMTNSSTTSETVTEYTDGTVEERQGTDTTSVSVPFLGSYSESDQLTATDDSRVENRTYTVTSTVNASSTQDVNEELARSTGTHYDTVENSLGNQSSRRWSVSSSFSHTQVESLVRQIRRGNWNYHSLIYQSGHGEDFRDIVLSAGDNWDAIDRGLADFIAETGDKGLELIRNTIGVTPRYSLTLAGDPYMTGEAGHAALARRISGWERNLSRQSNLQSTGQAIGRELRSQRERLDAISDPLRYPDLPNELRQREVTRTRREVERLDELRGEVLAAHRQQETERQQDPEPPEEQNYTDPDAPIMSEEPLSSQMTDEQYAATLRDAEWARVDAYAAIIEGKRESAISDGNVIRRHHYFQVEGAWCFSRSAIDTWGYEGVFSDGDNLSDFQEAQRFFDLHRSTWERGQEAYNDYLAARSRLEFSTDGNIESTLMPLLDRAQQKFGMAASSARLGSAVYARIRAAHPEGRNNQFQGYTQGKRLPANRAIR